MIAAAADWRTTFVILGIAGILVWFPYRRVVRDVGPAAPLPNVEVSPTRAAFGRLSR
jgi:hypothetical protein